MQTYEGYIKIGYSALVKQRLSGLQVGTPHELKLIGIIPGSYILEQFLHSKFKAYHVRGEWYNPDNYLLNTISYLLDSSSDNIKFLEGFAKLNSTPARINKYHFMHSGYGPLMDEDRSMVHTRQHLLP